MTREGTPLRLATVEPPADPAPPFRDRLAARCVEYDATYPRALDLEARVLAGMHAALHGVATLLRGLNSPRRFREALMGERHLKLAELCRLATEPTREARDAARAAVGELAASLGYRIEPTSAAALDAHEAQAGVIETHAALTAELSRNLADGNLSADEARELRPELDAHKAQLAQLEAVVSEAERRGQGGAGDEGGGR